MIGRVEETNPMNKECLKIETVPFFDAQTLPFILTITGAGLNLINLKVKRSYMFKQGKFKDFCFQVFGEFVDPVARLVYS